MADELKIIPIEEAVEEMGERGRTLFGAPKRAFGGFLDFVRERGVMGLAIGFVLGSAVQKVVTAFVTDLLNPIISIVLGRAENFKDFKIGTFLIGDFIMVTIDFLILCLIVYIAFKLLGLEKLDKQKT